MQDRQADIGSALAGGWRNKGVLLLDGVRQRTTMDHRGPQRTTEEPLCNRLGCRWLAETDVYPLFPRFG